MDPKTLQKLVDGRVSAVKELRDLATEFEDRAYDADAQVKEAKLNDAIADFDTRISNGVSLLESEARMADVVEKAGGFLPGRDEKREDASTGDEATLRKIATGEIRGETVFGPTKAELAWMKQIERRSTGVSKAGPPTTQQPGVVLPTIYTAVYSALRDLTTVVDANATIMRTAGYNPITMPMVSVHTVASIIGSGGEGQVIPESDPEFQGNVTWNSFKYGFLTTLTEEVLNDEAFDLVGWLGNDAGEAFSNGIGQHLLTGTGSGQPQGLLVGANSGLTLANKAGPTSDELLDLFHSIKVGYRNGAIWVLNDSSVKVIRKLKETTGQYIWQPGLVAGAPDTLLGAPVKVDQGVPALGSVNTKGCIGFGNVQRAYVIRYAGGLRVDRSTELHFDTDEISWRFIQRADGQTRDANAFKVTTNPAS